MNIKLVVSVALVTIGLSGCNNYSDELKEAPVLSGNAQAGAKVFDRIGCGGCHGEDAQTSALGVSRIIAQIDKVRDIENALYTMQSLTSDRHEVMKGIASNLNSQDIVDVAQYVHSLKQ